MYLSYSISVQEKDLRAISCNRNDTNKDLLKMAKLPMLYNCRLQDIAILMYKVKHNQCPKYISDLSKRTSFNYSLRNSDFSIPRVSTVTFGKHSVSYLGPVLWSKLSSEVKKSSEKYRLDELMMKQCHCSLCDSYLVS